MPAVTQEQVSGVSRSGLLVLAKTMTGALVAVNAAQNSFAGTRLATFYQNNRIIDHDNFWVSP